MQRKPASLRPPDSPVRLLNVAWQSGAFHRLKPGQSYQIVINCEILGSGCPQERALRLR